MQISVITLFPELFTSVFNQSISKRTLDNNKASLSFVNLRDFGIGKHKVVDDKPYGGGVGMVLRVDVLDKAISHTRKHIDGEIVILLDPKGKTYHQGLAENLSSYTHIILVCGHYEGVDERVRKLVDMELSIGDYILSGGEIGAIVVIDSLLRLVPGALIHPEATGIESFSTSVNGSLLEYPQYTRPEEYNALRVPEILLSGNHKQIEEWREKQAREITKNLRPDLLKLSH